MRRLSVLVSLLLISSTLAHATDCPPQAPSCKVITLTPDEEKVLLGPNGILDTASQGRPLDLGSLVAYFRQKVATAAAGEVKAPAADASKGASPRVWPGTNTPIEGDSAPIPKSDPRK